MSTIGFVGLGSMGAPIAGRLLQGNQVYGTNRTRAKAAGLIERGLIWRDTPREVAAAAQVVFSMVTDDAALAAITSGPDGILSGLAPGAVYVDMSTVSPRASRELAARVRDLGASMIDAPVSGSVPAAGDGSLAIMAGRTVTHVGGNGQGLLLKLAVNISLAVQMLAFSEGVLLATRGGIDPQVAVATMTGSAIGSPMLRTRAPLVLDLPEQAWFDVQLMHKDIRLALDAARESHIPLPSAAVADSMLSWAAELGYEHRDIAALFQVLERTLAAAPGDAGPGKHALAPAGTGPGAA